jgi:hypothetical protein
MLWQQLWWVVVAMQVVKVKMMVVEARAVAVAVAVVVALAVEGRWCSGGGSCGGWR